MIPYGFARGNEDTYSDSSLKNQAVMRYEITNRELANHYYSKLATKRGILRKQNNGTRPVNSFRLVASPPLAVSFRNGVPWKLLDRGYVEVSRRVLSKANFMHLSPDGYCSVRKIEVGETIIVGRCPSQGVDSIAIPWELCRLTNADFDGDEVWGLVPMTVAGSEEVEKRWFEMWESNEEQTVFNNAYEMGVRSNVSSEVDPAMLTTMTVREMSAHKGGKKYDSMMLKPTSWSQMYKVMMSKTYWQSSVTRGENGIFNVYMGRSSLADPYGYMRTGIIMGCCLNVNDDRVGINSYQILKVPKALNEKQSCSVP
ncbi:hypothetical protein EJ05DRAFT_490506 [Pseudovirgaria hyperparasitica]|uniref:Uncharacterized protein n=1 Tax=Pseudovirgaria hyperparasitica TaxID=470096 RepID=A0A6A6VT95_9PEZI|nr:uncharacterized protein EJ05DRAFT_490506 [Pseudovirgaria hyperparasitica]KAF2752974.1 hypothetical protein EJ05DRAFT_490506 [Pseudovirgaria hyperparasitica]